MIKDFDGFVNENLNNKILFDINLMEVQEYLDYMEEYWKRQGYKSKNNVTATLNVYSVSLREESEIEEIEFKSEPNPYNIRISYSYNNNIVDVSYFNSKYKVRFLYEYLEKPLDLHGIHEGLFQWNVYCGLDQLTKRNVLDIFFEMMDDTDYFDM